MGQINKSNQINVIHLVILFLHNAVRLFGGTYWELCACLACCIVSMLYEHKEASLIHL